MNEHDNIVDLKKNRVFHFMTEKRYNLNNEEFNQSHYHNIIIIWNTVILMTECRECKYYKPIDETRGDCFGHEVPATMNVDFCPSKAFTPR